MTQVVDMKTKTAINKVSKRKKAEENRDSEGTSRNFYGWFGIAANRSEIVGRDIKEDTKMFFTNLYSVKRKKSSLTIIVLTVVIFSACGGITKKVVDPGRNGAFVKIIINDAKIKNVDHGPDFAEKLKETFDKEFKDVSICTGYNDPQHGELVVTPLTLKLSCVQEPWEYFKGSTGVRLRVPSPNNPTIFKAESTLKVTNDWKSNSYNLVNEGSYKPSLSTALLGLALMIPDSFLMAATSSSVSLQIMVWKSIARGRALESTAIDFHNKVVASHRFKAYAESAKMVKTSPASLVTKIKYSDKSSLLPNATIDAGEHSIITATITNNGRGTAFNVNVEIQTRYNNVDFPKNTKVGDIQPGESKTIKIPLKAGLSLQSGTTVLLVMVHEKRGYDARPVELHVAAQSFLRPKLALMSHEINDGMAGLAKGNDNGIPENGETIEVMCLVTNQGEGEAVGVLLALEDVDSGIEVIQKEASLGSIMQGRIAKGKVALRIPRTYRGGDVSFSLAASDARAGRGATKKIALSFRHQSPVLSYESRLFYRGKEVTRLSNGETYDFEITPVNRGGIQSRNVNLHINVPALQFSPVDKPCGDIGPGLSFSTQRFKLHVPRSFSDPEIAVNVALHQSEFPESGDTLTIPVTVRSPKLGYSAMVEGRHGGIFVEQGESAHVIVQVKNEGDLDAKNIMLKMDILNPGIIVQGGKEIFVGNISSRSFSETIEFDLSVLRKVKPGEYPLRVSLTQSDFSDTKFEQVLTVKAERPEVVEVVGVATKKQRSETAHTTGPVVAIAKPRNGLRVNESRTELFGNVADAKGIDNIRVEVNGETVPVRTFGASGIKNKHFSASLALDDGENSIVVVARNSDNIISRKTITVSRITADSVGTSVPPLSLYCDIDRNAMRLALPGRYADSKKWSVVIGVENYRWAPPVPFARRDAQAVNEYFKRLLRVPAGNSFVLFDDQALLSELQDLLWDRLQVLVEEQDTVYFYFAGHGVPCVKDGMTYLLPYDGKPSNPMRTAFPSAELYASLGRLKARHVFVFLDACFSGYASRSEDRDLILPGTRPGVIKVRDSILASDNLIVFGASKPDQVSNAYREKQHGLFTYFLLKGLWGDETKDKKGVIRVKNLDKYIKSKVDSTSLKMLGRNLQQTPVAKWKHGKEDVVIVESKQ